MYVLILRTVWSDNQIHCNEMMIDTKLSLFLKNLCNRYEESVSICVICDNDCFYAVHTLFSSTNKCYCQWTVFIWNNATYFKAYAYENICFVIFVKMSNLQKKKKRKEGEREKKITIPPMLV